MINSKIDGLIKSAVTNSKPVTLMTYNYSGDTHKKVEEFLKIFLEYLSLGKLFNQLSFCINELITNGEKANTKRLFFKEKGLDIDVESEYRRGISEFKENCIDSSGNKSRYKTAREQEKLYVKVQFLTGDDKCIIYIRNNVVLAEMEKEAIESKIQQINTYSDMSEALALIQDTEEGAGLGLTMMMMLMKNAGLGEDVFKIYTDKDETVARLIFPISQKAKEDFNSLSDKIVDYVDSMPPFPENLINLQKLIKDPKSNIKQIADIVAKDPYLSAEIIKIVNSPAFVPANEIKSISSAVSFLGLRELSSLVFTFSIKELLKKHNDHTQILWTHANNTAMLICKIARELNIPPIKQDALFACGILHDIGKIPYTSLFPELISELKDLSSKDNISNLILEETLEGINHTEIGSRMARKWNFPGVFSDIIKYHHTPEDAPDKYRDKVYLVYLADVLENIKNSLFHPNLINENVLNHFGINSRNEFIERFSNLPDEY